MKKSTKKILETIILPVGVVGIFAATIGGCQYWLYNMTDKELHNIQKDKGMKYAVEYSQKNLIEQSDPMEYIFIPGYRMALADYIKDHKDSIDVKY